MLLILTPVFVSGDDEIVALIEFNLYINKRFCCVLILCCSKPVLSIDSIYLPIHMFTIIYLYFVYLFLFILIHLFDV